MQNLILREECYELIGLCMEVHRNLGMGFAEIIYKDALELEMEECGVPFLREQRFEISYKGTILRHYYTADFIVFNSIVLEVKATSLIVPQFITQTVNYLKAADLQLGIIANFGQRSFTSKRIVF